jgi:glycosyltransferase 2 family protein
MTQRIRSLLKYLLSAFLTILFLYLAFRGTDFGRLFGSLASAHYSWIVLYVAILLVSHVLRAWRWRYLLDPIKTGIGLRNLFSGVMIGYLMNNVLPRAGELVRPYSLAKLESVPRSSALGTIVVERIMDTISFLVLLLILPIVYIGPLSETFPWLGKAGLIVSLITGTVLAFMIVLVFRRTVLDIILTWLGHVLPERFSTRVEGMAHAFVDGFLFIKRPGSFAAILILSILVWLCYVVMTYVGFFAFDLEPALGLRAAIVVLTISSIGIAAPTPGSTGTYHFFASQTLVRLFAISDSVALSYATVTHAAAFVSSTLIGLYYLLHDPITVADAVVKGQESP